MNKLHAKTWAGTDNISRDTEVAGEALRNAANLDFTAGGKLASRRGYALLSAGAAASGFAFGVYLIYVRGGSLRSINTMTGATATLFAVSTDRVGHVEIDGALYVSDGVSKWKLNDQLQVSAWGTVAADDPTFDARLLIDFPACNKLAYWKGRMFGRIGNTVVYSLPFVFGSFDPRRNHFSVRGTVNTLHGNDDTLFVGANDVYAVTELGGPVAKVFAGKSVDAEPVVDDETDSAYWMTDRGLVAVGARGPEVVQISGGPVAMREASSAAIGLLKRDGATHIIVAMQPDSSAGEQNPLVSADYLRSEEMRKEIFDALQL